MPKIVGCLRNALVILLLSTGAAVAAESSTIAIPSLPQVRHAIGASPENVFTTFGRPAKVEHPGIPGFGVIGDERITLIQYYDVAGGGRVAFLYVGQYRVGGVAFDNLSSTRYIALSDFFETVPRTSVLESCIQGDAFHHMPGDEYDYDGAPNPTMVATVVRKWATASGGLFYARYRLDGHLRKRYDAVAGKDVFLPPTTLDGLSLLQFAWLPAAGKDGIGDAHPAQDTDLSTITFSQQGSPCYTASGELIRQ